MCVRQGRNFHIRFFFLKIGHLVPKFHTHTISVCNITPAVLLVKLDEQLPVSRD